MKEHVYLVFCPFGGMGAGARGFSEARVSLLGRAARFEVLGGIDFDANACADFETLTGVPELHADVEHVAAAEIRRRWPKAPDCVFMSPPCKGSSKLLPTAKAREPKYERMNRLALVWTAKMLEAWAGQLPPLILFENVPHITTRGAATIDGVRRMLRAAGYVTHEGYHDCGEIGGLAQHRRRFLMVARLPKRVPPLLYQPPTKRVRGCGEVLGELQLPEEDAGGPMHRMPRISWQNWIRLALIPAGGDWRDLPGVLAEGQQRRAAFRRHHLQPWNEPTSTIGGSGSNGPCAVADPRVDPRSFHHVLRVTPWTSPTGTVTSSPAPSSGAIAVADPRVETAYDHGYGVLHWHEPSPTVAAGSHPGQGAYSVADPRLPEPQPLEIPDGEKAPKTPPVIVAEDNTWHRPLTTLELAALQGLPTQINGRPLVLSGAGSTAWREAIGNAVPPPAAKAIAEQMLVTLVAADAQAFMLSGGGAVWVDAPDAIAPGWARLQ